MRTFCTRIGDPQADVLLAPYGEVFGRAQRWSYKQIHVLGRSVGEVKAAAVLKFGLTSRQFNGVRSDLDQMVNGWQGTLEYTIQRLTDSIDATVERIEVLGRQMVKARTDKRRAWLKTKQVGKKHRLDRLRNELAGAQRELAIGKPRICFGGRDLLRHDRMWEWQMRRSGRIYLIGARDDGVHGNQSVHWNGESLRVRMPNSLGGGFITLNGVSFRYGQAELLAILERNQDKATRIPLTWLLFRDEEFNWQVRVSFEEPPPPVTTSIRHGAVAVDLNVDHLAVVLVDQYGNPTGRLKLDFPESGTDQNVADAIIGNSVRSLCLIAKARGYGIACEDLEFGRKKAGLREYGKAHARRLSGWAYAKFYRVLQARCSRDGIELVQVNPAYTSVIGRIKYALGRAMSVHLSAALVIGRRAQGYGERLVTMTGALLVSPARNRARVEGPHQTRSVWWRWRGVRLLAREVQPARTARTAQWGPGQMQMGTAPRLAVATIRGARRPNGRVLGASQNTGTAICDLDQVGGAVARAQPCQPKTDTAVT